MLPRFLSLLLAISLPVPGFGQDAPRPARYIDDEKLMLSLEQSVLKLAEDGKAARGKDLLKQMNRKTCAVPAAPPSAAVLTPEEIYTGCYGGVVAITSAWKSEEGPGWEAGEPATAWVLAPEGVLVTNYHVFSDAEKDEVFGVMTRDGVFYPVTEILAADHLNDVAVFKIPAKGLQPLAVGVDEPVGKHIAVISHPDRQFYTFTQGQISRYTLQYDDAKAPPVKYMCITADYARGSSGGPVLNDHGAVIGMVCSTRTTYYGEKNKEEDDDVQMIVKFCIPGESILGLLKSTPTRPPELPENADVPPIPVSPPVPGPEEPAGTQKAEAPKARPVPEPEPPAGAPASAPDAGDPAPPQN